MTHREYACRCAVRALALARIPTRAREEVDSRAKDQSFLHSFEYSARLAELNNHVVLADRAHAEAQNLIVAARRFIRGDISSGDLDSVWTQAHELQHDLYHYRNWTWAIVAGHALESALRAATPLGDRENAENSEVRVTYAVAFWRGLTTDPDGAMEAANRAVDRHHAEFPCERFDMVHLDL